MVKAAWRGAEACIRMGLASEAGRLAALAKLLLQGRREKEEASRESQSAWARWETLVQDQEARLEKIVKGRKQSQRSAYELAEAVASRGIRVGPPGDNLVVSYKPRLLPGNNEGGVAPTGERSNTTQALAWPVVLLYPEAMQSDVIEDWDENTTVREQLDHVFGSASPGPGWDSNGDYTKDRVELYYETAVDTAALLDSAEAPNAAEGAGADRVAEGDGEASKTMGSKGLSVDELAESYASGFDTDEIQSDYRSLRYVRVHDSRTLQEVLTERHHVVPWIPIFYVVAKGTRYHAEFLQQHQFV